MTAVINNKVRVDNSKTEDNLENNFLQKYYQECNTGISKNKGRLFLCDFKNMNV